jgi:hypothetical protein
VVTLERVVPKEPPPKIEGRKGKNNKNKSKNGKGANDDDNNDDDNDDYDDRNVGSHNSMGSQAKARNAEPTVVTAAMQAEMVGAGFDSAAAVSRLRTAGTPGYPAEKPLLKKTRPREHPVYQYNSWVEGNKFLAEKPMVQRDVPRGPSRGGSPEGKPGAPGHSAEGVGGDAADDSEPEAISVLTT